MAIVTDIGKHYSAESFFAEINKPDENDEFQTSVYVTKIDTGEYKYYKYRNIKIISKYFDTNLPRNEKIKIVLYDYNEDYKLFVTESLGADAVFCFSNNVVVFARLNCTPPKFLPRGFVEETIYKHICWAKKIDPEKQRSHNTTVSFRSPLKKTYKKIFFDETPFIDAIKTFQLEETDFQKFYFPVNFYLRESDGNLIFTTKSIGAIQKIFFDDSFAYDSTRPFNIQWRNYKYFVRPNTTYHSPHQAIQKYLPSAKITVERKREVFVAEKSPIHESCPTFVLFTGENTLFVYELQKTTGCKNLLPLVENKKYVEICVA